MTIALISRGGLDANRVKSAEHGLAHVLLQRDFEVADAYQSYITPSAVLVRPDGTIASSLVEGAEEIRALVARTAGIPVGMPMLEVVPAAAPHTKGSDHCPDCGQIHQHDIAAPRPDQLRVTAPRTRTWFRR